MSGQTNGFDVRGLLERTDARMARKNGDDPLPPETIDAFAQAVEAQLPKLNGNGAGGSSATVVAALERDIAEAKSLAASVRSERDRLAMRLQEVQIDLAAARQELEQLRRDGGRAVEIVGETGARVTALQDQLDAQQTELEKLGREHGKSLQENLQLTERVDAQRDELDAVNAERDQLRTKLGEALKAGRPRHTATPVHEHRYPQAAPDELPGPCECGKPFPRALFDDPEDDEVAGYELTGWDEQWEQIRAELEQLGWPDGDEPPGEVDPDAFGAAGYLVTPSTDAAPALELAAAEATELGNKVSAEPVEREAKRSTRARVAECGTESGYARHRRNDEDACTPCKQAIAAAQKRRSDAKKARESAGEVAG